MAYFTHHLINYGYFCADLVYVFVPVYVHVFDGLYPAEPIHEDGGIIFLACRTTDLKIKEGKHEGSILVTTIPPIRSSRHNISLSWEGRTGIEGLRVVKLCTDLFIRSL